MPEYNEQGYNPDIDNLQKAYELLGLSPDANSDQIERAYLRVRRELEAQKFKGQAGDGRLVSETEFTDLEQARELALRDFRGSDTQELDPDFPKRIQQ